MFVFITVEPKLECPKHLKLDENEKATKIKVNISANPKPNIEWEIDGNTYFEGKSYETYLFSSTISEVSLLSNRAYYSSTPLLLCSTIMYNTKNVKPTLVES